MKIILASQSPQRKELMDLMNLKYEIIVSDVDETFVDNLPITEQSKRLAYIKAKEVFNKTTGDPYEILSYVWNVPITGRHHGLRMVRL